MLYLIHEDFKGDPVPVYRRFRDQVVSLPRACAT